MQNFFPESKKNDTTEKIESSKRVHYEKQTQHNSSSTNQCKIYSQNLRKMIRQRK